MSHNVIFSLTALLTLLPAAIYPYRRIVGTGGQGRAVHFWAALALSVIGSSTWAFAQIAANWTTGLSAALWITIAVCLLVFIALSAISRSGWRLSPILLPYLLVLAMVATATQRSGTPMLVGGAPNLWLYTHIGLSVLTYALLTLAGVASLAAFLQERALKTKRPTSLTRFLPPVAESERLQFRLLVVSETALFAGLVSGLAVLHYEWDSAFGMGHKMLFAIATFFVIGILLLAQSWTGVRGRAAARVVLIAYLLLTLAYPGVKFVTSVLME